MSTKRSITFHTDTLEQIISNPAEILDHYEEFWNTERPMILTQKWANQVGHEIDYAKHRKELEEWAHLTQEERNSHPFTLMAKKIISEKERVLTEAIPHISKFLPEECEFDVPIDFIAFIPSRAFACEDIVINVAATYWKNDPLRILNAIIHEVFHAGHSFYRQICQPEVTYEKPILKTILNSIQGEGICNYVSYTGQSIYPIPYEDDYIFFENPNDVKTALDRVNLIFQKVDQIPEEEVRKIAWDLGVMKRAYYVIGQYMWYIIDQKLGRAALMDELKIDLYHFIITYNSLVDTDMQIHLPEIRTIPVVKN